MSVAKNGCAVVNIDGNVYVMGGLDGTTALATVECYDPVANEWRLLPSMSSAKSCCFGSTFIDKNNPKWQTADPLWGSSKLDLTKSYCAAVVGETGHG
jgi:hypothetical protein